MPHGSSSKEYSTYANLTTLSGKKSYTYKQVIITIVVSLIFFFSKKVSIDLRAVRLLRDWEHPKAKYISIIIASLTFLYCGLTKIKHHGRKHPWITIVVPQTYGTTIKPVPM